MATIIAITDSEWSDLSPRIYSGKTDREVIENFLEDWKEELVECFELDIQELSGLSLEELKVRASEDMELSFSFARV
jgi:hypothetical protein